MSNIKTAVQVLGTKSAKSTKKAKFYSLTKERTPWGNDCFKIFSSDGKPLRISSEFFPEFMNKAKMIGGGKAEVFQGVIYVTKIQESDLVALIEQYSEHWTTEKPQRKAKKVDAKGVRNVLDKEKDAEMEALKASVKELTELVKVLARR